MEHLEQIERINGGEAPDRDMSERTAKTARKRQSVNRRVLATVGLTATLQSSLAQSSAVGRQGDNIAT